MRVTEGHGPGRRLRLRAGVAFIAVALLVGMLPVTGTASELPPDNVEDPDRAAVRPSAKRLLMNLDSKSSAHVWVWSAGRRAYHLQRAPISAPGSGYERIVATSTDTGQPIASERLQIRGYDPSFSSVYPVPLGSGLERTIAIDEAQGRLFVATMEPARVNSLSTTGVEIAPVRNAAKGQLCGHVGAGTAGPNCVTGVSVVDATTLAHVRHLPLRSVQVDGGAAGATLLAMSYAAPFEGVPGKVHLLVQESAYWTSATNLAGFTRYNPRNAYNVTYAVQLDPETGVQDWVVRLDGCRGGLAGSSENQAAAVNTLPQQATVFRSRLAGDRAVYVGCHSNPQSFTGAVMRVPLDEHGTATTTVVPDLAGTDEPPPAGELDTDPQAMQLPSFELNRPYTVEGPDYVYGFIPDVDSGRIAMQVVDGRPRAMVWYVFDTRVMQFAGTIGIGGPVAFPTSLATIAPETGRLYTFLAPLTEEGKSFAGGLFAADIRRTPVPQALHFPHMTEAFPPADSVNYAWALTPETLPGGGVRLWMPDQLKEGQRPAYIAVEDVRPLDAAPPELEFEGRTLDLDEVEGVTSSTFDGAARGFGFRALLVGGAEATLRAGPADPVGAAGQCNDPSWEAGEGDAFTVVGRNFDLAFGGKDGGTAYGPCYRLNRPLPTQCGDATREAIFAIVGPREAAVIDGSGARGAAEPLLLDGATMTDAAAPASRCSRQDWDALWGTALFGRAPVPEPSGNAERLRTPVACLSAGEETEARSGDAVVDGFSAQVRCSAEGSSGHAYARGVGVAGVQVAEALSSYRIYRDPERGIVSRVESVARGVGIDGLLRIDTVRGIAESWANGRAFGSQAEEEGQAYDPNCDRERTAGTCFTRQLFGLWTPGYRCGPCGDEQAFVRGVNAALNPNVLVRLRDPDQRLRIGAENGFAAAVQKPEHERFTDLVLNNDLLQTMLVTLEVIRFAPANRPASRGGPRGRQVYQFAGVEVSSSYGISCLLVYDEATNTCAGEKQLPGSIQVSLSDSDGEPLAGGAFEVRQDVDADGVLGLKDTLLPDGACVTADDGVGTCTFENLQPGTYLVSQVAAPPGYAKSSEPWVSEVASGEQRTVAFTNVSNVSTIDLTATDENGAPLSGAVFAAYPDPDSDGKVAPDAQPAAECTTGAQGVCTMKVPAGSYVLVQTAAPGGLEGIEPVPFTFASGGQVASVSVVNYPPASPSQPAAAASPIYTPPVDQSPPREFIDDSYVAAPVDDLPVVDEPVVSVPDRIGGTVTQVIRAPGDALRLLARDPKQAVAWTAALALFVLAVMAIRRRQQAVELIRQ